MGEPATFVVQEGERSEVEVVASVDEDKEVMVRDALTGEPKEDAVIRARAKSSYVKVLGERIKLAALLDAVIAKEVELKALGDGRFLLPGMLRGALEKRVLELAGAGQVPRRQSLQSAGWQKGPRVETES